jgi:hypothetical protein
VSPAIILRIVLLPLPLGPRRTRSSPSPISSETWFTIAWRSNLFVIWSSTIDIREAYVFAGHKPVPRDTPLFLTNSTACGDISLFLTKLPGYRFAAKKRNVPDSTRRI